MSEVLVLRDEDGGDNPYPLAQLTKAGDFLWLTGQTAYGPNGDIVGIGDFLAQGRRVFENIRHILGRVGCDLSSIVRLTTYFALPLNRDLARQYWQVRKEFFGTHLPASTGIQVAALIESDLLIEIDAIAYAPGAVLPS